MSAIQFLTSGGMASIGGDLRESVQKSANEIVKVFGERVRKYAVVLKVPASLLKVQPCTFLFVAKDTSRLHFIFADALGCNSINYRNLFSYGRFGLQSIVHLVRIEVGDVALAFSCLLNVPISELEEYIQE
jgi:hypothetical protein